MAINTSDLIAVPLLSELPNLLKAVLGAVVVLLIGYLIAKAIQGLLHKGLHKAGLDRASEKVPGGTALKGVGSPSALIGRISFWLIMLGAISLAVSVLGIDALTRVLDTVYAYIPNVIAAAAILLVAGAASAALVAFLGRVMGQNPATKLMQTVAPGLIMAIALFMVLDQLRIAETIVTITFAAVMGALALGSALAFGLGGRDMAARVLDDAYSRGRSTASDVKASVAENRQRAGAQDRSSQTRDVVRPGEEVHPTYGTQAQPSFGERIDPR